MNLVSTYLFHIKCPFQRRNLDHFDEGLMSKNEDFCNFEELKLIRIQIFGLLKWAKTF